MNIYIENEKGDQFAIKVTDQSQEVIDEILDEMIKPIMGVYKFIEEKDFLIKDPMIIDLMNDDHTKKVGELYCNKISGL